MPRGGKREGGGRPFGSVKAEGIRKQKQMRAYDDEWELIQVLRYSSFAVSYTYKHCL